MSTTLPVSLPPAGVGLIQPFPAATVNGTPLPSRPAGAQGILPILGPGDSVTLTYRTAAQGASTAAPAPSNCATYAAPTGTVGDAEGPPQFFVEGMNCYITAATPGARFRWM